MQRPLWLHMSFVVLFLFIWLAFISAYRTLRSAPPSTLTPPRKRKAIWERPDAPEEQVLALRREILQSPPVKRICVLPRLGAVFCPIPGVASKALMHALERAEGVGVGELPILAEYALRDRERFLVRKDVFRFVFVRHPFSRILSAFYAGRAFSELDSPEYREFMGHVRDRPLAPDEHELQPLSFSFFLTFLSSNRRNELWERFRPQNDLCGLDSFEYAFVGHLEEFQKGIMNVEQHLSRTLRPLDPPPFSSNASRNMGVMFKSRKIRAKVIKLYSADLKLLRYSSVV